MIMDLIITLKLEKNSQNLILTLQKLYKQLIINRTTIIKTGIKFLNTVYYAIIFIIYLQIIMLL
ncbi:hypothetical protein CMT42_04175 [Elizabethkingia anophelis]|nr:hypothetical protein M876_05710 [Elizabethkingia anophelis FMS-007]MDV2443023.1 hypothetical protein [Elizabethkingia anophelis]MDV2466627.1 hypothetical protein [Elizabethkingia anophelis]MDV3538815.1 hypothetical protein [Elizabethkingia anophelis]MDV3611493.1 hypothetical protein [Elizabethkingia anophelis]